MSPSTVTSASCQGRFLTLHLRTPEQFQVVMNAGVLAQSPHFALHGLRLSAAGVSAPLFTGAHSHLGVVLPKRHAKKAVRRNMLRRQIVSLGRDLNEALQDSALVVRLKRGFDDQTFVSARSVPLKKAVRAELGDLFSRGLGRLRPKGTVA